MSRWMLKVVIGALVMFTACSGGSTEAPDQPNEGTDATIEFTKPEEDASIKSDKLKVAVEVTGLEIVNEIGEENAAGEGHIVFYASNGFADDYVVPTAQGQPANSGGVGYIGAAVAETKYDWSVWNLKPGKQKLAAQLVNNDNTPLSPPVVTDIMVDVKKGDSPPPTPPSDGYPVPGTGVQTPAAESGAREG